VKQQHTSTATSILTNTSTYRSLSAQRLSEHTVYHCARFIKRKFCVISDIIIIFSGPAAQRGLWPPVVLQPSAGYGLLVSRGFLITHNDAPQLVRLLWTSDQFVAETSDNTQHTRQTNINAPGGIRNHDRSRGAAVDLRLRPRGHWDQQYLIIQDYW
jgi:hypothetical protein